MKHAACLALLALSAALLPGLGRAEDCPGPDHPAITVKIQEGEVKEDRTLSIIALSKLPSASKRSGMEAYDHTLGLTQADVGADADLEFLTVPRGGGFCTTARETVVTLKWSSTVHLAAELAAGSCLERVVGAHEQKHVALDRALLPVGREAIEIALQSALRSGAVGGTADESRNALQQKARKAISGAIDIFAEVRTRRQLELDSPEEYDKVPKACGVIEYWRLMLQADKKKADS